MKGKKTGGRQPGSPNRLSLSAKECISQVAQRLGGVDALYNWVNADNYNKNSFWTKIYPRLLPVQLTGDGQAPISILIQAADKSA